MDTILEIGVGVEGSNILCSNFSKYFDYVQARCEKRFYSPFGN